MKTITIEEHFLTANSLKATAKVRDAGLALTYHDPALEKRLLDIGAGRIADMDASGIDMQALSLAVCGVEELQPAEATAVVHDTNEEMAAAVKANPTRFVGFAAIALQEPEKAAAEFDYCVKKLGFKGLLINGTTNGKFLDHPSFTSILEVAHSNDLPIYIHPAPIPMAVRKAYYSELPDHWGDMLSIGAWGWHSEVALEVLRLIVAGVFDRFPKLKIAIGHMGENLPFAMARVDRILGRVERPYTLTPAHGKPGDVQHRKPLQRRPIEYFRENIYVTTSGFFTLPPFICATQVIESDHLLFSVDHPFTPNAMGREFLDCVTKQLALQPDNLKKFTHQNAQKLLKL
jgi:predicted TIM-barrel fold metal-dependent hydrolase